MDALSLSHSCLCSYLQKPKEEHQFCHIKRWQSKLIKERQPSIKYLWFQYQGKWNTWGLLWSMPKPPACSCSADTLWLLHKVSKILRRLLQRVCFTTLFLYLTAQFTLCNVLINLSLLVIYFTSLWLCYNKISNLCISAAWRATNFQAIFPIQICATWRRMSHSASCSLS